MRYVFLLVVAAFTSFAQDAQHPRRWKVHAELQVIPLPEKTAIALLPELRDEGKIEAAWKRIETMLADGGATLVAAPITAQ